MKLLFDQNLSHKLVDRLQQEFPDSLHVRNIGLASADDSTIVRFALAQGFTIVSKDADFLALRFVLGEHVRMVWVRLGNGSTDQVEKALRTRRASIEALVDDPSQVIEIV
jgi:predicted nuclease of predicted toxin-antitoxin system